MTYNYQPNSAQTTLVEDSKYDISPIGGEEHSVQQPVRIKDEYRQAGELYRSLNKQDQDDLITNLLHDLSQITIPEVKLRAVTNFYKADKNYGTRLAEALHMDVQQVADNAAKQ